MGYTFFSLIFVVLHITSVQINAQYCVPAAVENLVLHDESILSWNPSPNEPCTIDRFLIYIVNAIDWVEQLFSTDQITIDVGHLPDCTEIWVTVIPVSSDNVEGNSTIYYTKTPAPANVNLDISSLVLSVIYTGLKLEWEVDAQWERCVKQFRMLRYNADDDEIQTHYMTYPYAYIYGIVPCASYVFTVTALYNLETEGRVSTVRYTAPSGKMPAPELQSVTLGTTTVDFTWALQELRLNRCPVNAIILDSSPYFNISYPISGQNQFNREQSLRLTNLQPDTMYMLRVTANNTAGPSDPFMIGVQTLGSN